MQHEILEVRPGGGRRAEVEPAVYRRLWQPDIATQFGLIEDLPQAQAGGLHQASEVRQRTDRGDVLQVAPLRVGYAQQFVSTSCARETEYWQSHAVKITRCECRRLDGQS